MARFQLAIKPFVLKNGRLHLPSELFFHHEPERLITIFAYAQKYDLDIHPDSFKRPDERYKSASASGFVAASIFIDHFGNSGR